MLSTIGSIWEVLKHTFRRRVTVQYPDAKPYLPPRFRGRIILARDPSGAERCVACYLCAVACPVDCIALQTAEDEHGRRYPEFFRINFTRISFSFLQMDFQDIFSFVNCWKINEKYFIQSSFSQEFRR